MYKKSRLDLLISSPQRFISACLVILAAVFTFISNRSMLKYNYAPYTIAFIILPILSYILYGVFVLLISERHPKLMLIPLCLVCLIHINNYTGLNYLFKGLSGAYQRMWETGKWSLIYNFINAFVLAVIMVFGIISYFNRLKLVFILLCIFNIILTIVLNYVYSIKYSFIFAPLGTLTYVLFHGAFILSALDAPKEWMPNDENYS